MGMLGASKLKANHGEVGLCNQPWVLRLRVEERRCSKTYSPPQGAPLLAHLKDNRHPSERVIDFEITNRTFATSDNGESIVFNIEARDQVVVRSKHHHKFEQELGEGNPSLETR